MDEPKFLLVFYLYVIFATVYLLTLAISFAFWIFRGVGLMNIAKSMGIPYAWRSFIPVASEFLVGRVAEKSENALKNGKKYASRILLFEVILLIALIFAYPVGLLTSSFSIEPVTRVFSIAVFVLMLSALLTFLVFYWISLYNVYKIVSPKQAVLFIILSIVFCMGAEPIILFCIRNKLAKLESNNMIDTSIINMIR